MEDEMPPEWMWSLDEELGDWFEEVEKKRKDKYGRNDDDDRNDSSPMMQNDFARDRR